ncbi:AraC family transcriptional regulator [Chitinasiproducens palmae]|uniref:AraC-type DNA-binding protein n=1 Tax=Chitinasiproducens palmae TaxID=1770053 RepID=A0A1H2PMB9_9BURK|nr:AraC family transcriptional regulator [Chitinasiproducens palmae]SDV47253.1 AraC-type DNA-binding protein [Chitinasiproducens palmae]
MNTTDRFALSSELISELLSGMRLHGVHYRRIQTGPVFGMKFNDRPGHAYFHYLAVGSAVLRTRDGTLHALSAGNAVYMPHGESHALLSSAEVTAPDIDSFDVAPLGEAVSGMDTCPSTSVTPSAILFHGCMAFDLGGMQGLGPLMPSAMAVDATDGQYPGLVPILDAMKREICSGRIGFAGILARLADVVAAMIVRGWVESGCDDAAGLVAALRDPRLAPAILALHRHPGRDWNVAELAAECHASRSVFAERFQATIGMPPLRYATELRMRLASQLLTQKRLSIDVVAQRLGYKSQAAFSRAYKRITGQPPGASRLART